MLTHANPHHSTNVGLLALMSEDPATIVDLYGKVAAHAPLPIAMTVGHEHLLCGANSAFCQLLGSESPALLGQSLVVAVPTSDTDRVRSLLDMVYHTGAAPDGDGPQLIRSVCAQGDRSYIVWPIPDDRGRADGLVVLIHDTTAHGGNDQLVQNIRALNQQLLLTSLHERDLAEQLQRQLVFIHNITTSLGEGLYTLDHTGRFILVNPAAEWMLGWTEVELLGRNAHDVIHSQDATSAGGVADAALLLSVMRSGTAARDEHALWTRHDGTLFPTVYSAAPIVADGQVVGVVVVFRDMTEVQQAALTLARQTEEVARSHAELEHLLAEVQALALTDDLTTLYNRRGFFTLAAQQMKVAKRTQHTMSLIFIDLDGLKSINDRWGHRMGAHAIIAAADILTASFRDSDIVARFGGDEFVVLAMDSDGQDPAKVLQRLQRQCAQHNLQADTPYQLSMSIGIAHLTAAQPCSLEELLEQADAQMYIHKQTKSTSRSVDITILRDRSHGAM